MSVSPKCLPPVSPVCRKYLKCKKDQKDQKDQKPNESTHQKITLAEVELSLRGYNPSKDLSKRSIRILADCAEAAKYGFDEKKNGLNLCWTLSAHGTAECVIFYVQHCGVTIFFREHEFLRLSALSDNYPVMKYILSNIHPSCVDEWHHNATWDMDLFPYPEVLKRNKLLDVPDFIKTYLGSIPENTWKDIFIRQARIYHLKWFERAFNVYKIAEPTTPLFYDTEFVNQMRNIAREKNPELWKDIKNWMGGIPPESPEK